MTHLSLLLFLPLLFLPLCTALLPTGLNTSIPAYSFSGVLPPDTTNTLPEACLLAYSTRINCNETILMSPSNSTKKATLPSVCNPACAESLAAYQTAVRKECAPNISSSPYFVDTWLAASSSGTAALDLYWTHCLRDAKTDVLCDISEEDFILAWNAAVEEFAQNGGDRGVQKRAFCENSCLVQTIVLTEPSEANLRDLQTMCKNGGEVKGVGFLEELEFAGLVEETEEGVVAKGTVEKGRDVLGVNAAGRVRVEVLVGMVGGVFIWGFL